MAPTFPLISDPKNHKVPSLSVPISSQLSGIPNSWLCMHLDLAFPSSVLLPLLQSRWMTRQRPFQLQAFCTAESNLSPTILKAQLSLSHCTLGNHNGTLLSTRSGLIFQPTHSLSFFLLSRRSPQSPQHVSISSSLCLCCYFPCCVISLLSSLFQSKCPSRLLGNVFRVPFFLDSYCSYRRCPRV